MATTIDPQAHLATKPEAAPLRIRTLLLFLIGNRQAILDIAANRHALWIGALFVLSAAFARDYDGEDLLHEPWHLLIPFAASIVASLLLFIVACGRLYLRKTDRPPFFSAYRSFLALFWMTAPLAWAYAVPYERFLSPVDAVHANLATLAVVALWRVLLMVRVVNVLTALEGTPSAMTVLLFADLLAIVALSQMPTPIIGIMGGVRATAPAASLGAFTALLWLVCAGALPVFCIGALVSLAMDKPAWRAATILASSPRSSRGIRTLAVGSVAIWAVFVPWTQREQVLRFQVTRLFQEGQIAGAVDFMSAHSQSDFPPQWDPPPRTGRRDLDSQMLDTMESIIARNAAPWVHALYVDKFRAFLGHPALFYFYWRDENLSRITRIMESVPEGSELARERAKDVEERLKDETNMPKGDRENLQAILDLAKSSE